MFFFGENKLRAIGTVSLLLLSGFLVMTAHAQNVSAQDASTGEIGELQQLLETEVTGTGRKESLRESPAIMTVVKSEQIQKWGASRLSDILQRVPGVNLVETYFGIKRVTIRGASKGQYNTKTKLLLNGHPMFETTKGTFRTASIPVNAVKRVEIIRGPNSVEYGTNAYAGVINVITKKGSDLDGSEMSVTAGSRKTRGVDFASGGSDGELEVSVVGSYHADDGYNFNVQNDEDGRSGQPKFGGFESYVDDRFQGVLNLSYNDISLQAYTYDQEKSKFGIQPRLRATGPRFVDGQGIDLTYRIFDSDRTSVELFSWYDQNDKQDFIKNFPADTTAALPQQGVVIEDYRGEKFGTDLKLSHEFTDGFDFNGGLVYEWFKTSPFLFKQPDEPALSGAASPWTDEFTTNEAAAYGKFTYSFTDDFTANAGARFADNSQFGSQVAYNAGSVYTFTDRWTGKLLYGHAYRAPSFFEKRVNGGPLRGLAFGNSAGNFEPETIDNIDLLLMYEQGNHLVQANPFYIESNDKIGRRPPEPGEGISAPLTYDNLSGDEISGLTLSYQGVFDQHTVEFDLTQQTGESTDSGQDIEGIAELTALAEYNYEFTEPDVNANLFLKHVGERDLTVDPDGGPARDETVSSYNLLDANVTWNGLGPNSSLSFKGTNLLDEDYSYPEDIRKNIKSIPGGPGRSYFITLTQTF